MRASMRVAELRERLAGLPDDVEVAVAAHVIAGVVTDVAPTALVDVDHGRADDGTLEAVWLVAIGDPIHEVPPLLTFACGCGHQVAIRDGHEWPVEHIGHLYPQ